MRGKFIVFEGIDGSGKSTQIDMLYRYILQKNIKAHKTFEPTNREIGKLLRRYLSGEIKANISVVAGLFASDRLDHFLNDDDGILKHINEGTCVLCDRNYFSSFAYQTTDNDSFSFDINQKVREILKPDLHIFIDLKPKDALKRIQNERSHIEIYENLSKLENVYENYLYYFDKLKDEENILFVDGNQTADQISSEIIKKTSYLFN